MASVSSEMSTLPEKHASAIAVVCHSESSMWSTSSRAGPRERGFAPAQINRADPFQVAFLAKLAQRHVGLLLKVFREVGSTPPAIQVRPERRLGAELMEGACERVVRSGVSTLFQKCGDEGPVAGHQHIQERNCRDTRAVLHRQFNERQIC